MRLLKISAPNENSMIAPNMLPNEHISMGPKICFPIILNSFLNAGSAAILPGAVAMKFVALAETGDNPANIRAGNVKKVAPPATAFKIPARNPVKNKTRKNNISKIRPNKNCY